MYSGEYDACDVTLSVYPHRASSGEYDACDVTLSVYPHQASLKNMPDHGGNRTYDLWNTSPMPNCKLMQEMQISFAPPPPPLNISINQSNQSINQNNLFIHGKIFSYKVIQYVHTIHDTHLKYVHDKDIN